MAIERWDAAQIEHVRQRTHGVGTAAETEQVDPVARFVAFEDRLVAINDVAAEPQADRLAGNGTDPLPQPKDHRSRNACGSYSGIVEGDLSSRIDGTVRATASGPKQFVDVAQLLIGPHAADLAGPVCENENVLCHALTP